MTFAPSQRRTQPRLLTPEEMEQWHLKALADRDEWYRKNPGVKPTPVIRTGRKR